MSVTLVHVDSDDLHSMKKTCAKEASAFGEVEDSCILLNAHTSQPSNLNTNEAREVVLPNGDMYVLHGCSPRVVLKYIWLDGSIYQGEWKRGAIDGHGKMVWSSGDIYEGNFSGGYIHGIGTYTVHDKAIYKGEWSFNVRHGLGRKIFPNGDIFEGSWVEGIIEGFGKYIWSNGNVYIGNMKGGKMSGKGVITWINGDSFEGNWMDGMIHGFGIYSWSDGGFYAGTWTQGLKDGRGVFYAKGGTLTTLRQGSLVPTVKKHRSTPVRRAASVDLGSLKFHNTTKSNHGSSTSLSGGIHKAECTHSLPVEQRCSLQASVGNVTDHKVSTAVEDSREEIDEVEVDIPVREREYVQGVLISEFIINKDTTSVPRDAKIREKKPVKELKRPGETIIKGHRSYDLMINLQLGIRYTVGKITPIQRREVQESDFGRRACFLMNFPRQGSQLTPPHQSVDFKWKDYCPMVFRYFQMDNILGYVLSRNLREMFKIDAADYMISICGNDALRELSSPGKSGSVFFLSQDDRFMIKTLRRSEVQVLLHMLPDYHHHVQAYENTLITKFFGLHRIKTGRTKFRFVVMGNMFCTELRIHRRFDLKGSSQGRSANKVEIDENTILKDLDLRYQFYLEPSWREFLLNHERINVDEEEDDFLLFCSHLWPARQIELDCKFLEAQRIMDYSLLLGVHYRAPQYLQSLKSDCGEDNPGEFRTLAEDAAREEESSSHPEDLVLVPRRPDGSGAVFGPHMRGSRLRASAAGDREVDLLLPGTARLHIQLGVNMPARAEPISQEEGELFHQAYDVVLYLGVIDILQAYNTKKKIEHACKSLQFDSFSISVVKPTFYSLRFLKFLEYVFPKSSLER